MERNGNCGNLYMDITAVITSLLTLLAGIGAFMGLFAKKSGTKTLGGILASGKGQSCGGGD